MSKAVCLIPARGNSKRIPGKNIKPFLGKPIITYPIETAKASGIFDDIVICTDSQEISHVVTPCNVWGRADSKDNETLTEMIYDFIISYNAQKFNIDYLSVLLPTAVFVTKNEILEGYSASKLKDCAITFCQYPHPIQRAFYIKDGIKMIKNEYLYTRTQDLEPRFYDAGQMYFLNVKSFLEQKRIFMDNIYPIIIDAVDIDNPEDWKKAEAYYKVLKND